MRTKKQLQTLLVFVKQALSIFTVIDDVVVVVVTVGTRTNSLSSGTFVEVELSVCLLVQLL